MLLESTVNNLLSKSNLSSNSVNHHKTPANCKKTDIHGLLHETQTSNYEKQNREVASATNHTLSHPSPTDKTDEDGEEADNDESTHTGNDYHILLIKSRLPCSCCKQKHIIAGTGRHHLHSLLHTPCMHLTEHNKIVTLS